MSAAAHDFVHLVGFCLAAEVEIDLLQSRGPHLRAVGSKLAHLFHEGESLFVVTLNFGYLLVVLVDGLLTDDLRGLAGILIDTVLTLGDHFVHIGVGHIGVGFEEIGIVAQALFEGFACCRIVMLEVEVDTALHVPRTLAVGALGDDVGSSGFGACHIVVVVVDADEAFHETDVVLNVGDGLLQAVHVGRGVMRGLHDGLELHQVEVAFLLREREAAIDRFEHLIPLLLFVGEDGHVVGRGGIAFGLGLEERVLHAGEGGVVGEIEVFAKHFAGTHLVAVLVEKYTSIEEVVLATEEHAGVVGVKLGLGHLTLFVGRVFSHVTLGVVVVHLAEAVDERRSVERLILCRLHQFGIEELRCTTAGHVVDFIELGRLRIVKRRLKQGERFGAFVFTHQGLGLVDDAVLGNPTERACCQHSHSKDFLHGGICC